MNGNVNVHLNVNENVKENVNVNENENVNEHEDPLPQFQNCRFPNVDIYRNYHFRKGLGIFLDYLKYPDVSKDANKWFWGSGTRPKILKP